MSKRLYFPLICYLNGKLVVHTEKSFDAIGAKLSNRNTFVTIENRKRATKAGWIMDANGEFFKLTPTGSRNKWARPFAFLWNMVQAEYNVEDLGVTTVDNILSELECIPKGSLGKIGDDLKRFLQSEDPETLVTNKLLSRWPL